MGGISSWRNFPFPLTIEKAQLAFMSFSYVKNLIQLIPFWAKYVESTSQGWTDFRSKECIILPYQCQKNIFRSIQELKQNICNILQDYKLLMLNEILLIPVRISNVAVWKPLSLFYSTVLERSSF